MIDAFFLQPRDPGRRIARAVELAYDRRGAGATLVLLHPLGADRHVWTPVIDRLAGERDVIALDLPGFGDSPVLNTDGPPTPAALADAVAGFLDGLELAGGYHVAGNSLGGWVALELAAAGRALSVTAIAPAGLWPEPLAPKRGLARRLARAADPLLPALTRSAGGRRLVLGGTVADPSRLLPHDALRLVRAYARAPGFDAVNAAMRAARFTRLEQVRVPVTLAWAERDRLVAPPASVPSTVTSVALPGVGHMPMWDAPIWWQRSCCAEAAAESARRPRFPAPRPARSACRSSWPHRLIGGLALLPRTSRVVLGRALILRAGRRAVVSAVAADSRHGLPPPGGFRGGIRSLPGL